MNDDLPALWLAGTADVRSSWPWWGHLIATIIILLAFAFFNAFEVALVALKDQQVRREAQDGKGSAKRLLALMEKIGEFRSTTKAALYLLGLIYGVFALAIFPWHLSRLWPDFPHFIFHILCAVLFTALLVVFGQMLPQRLAQHHGDRFAAIGVYFFGLFRLILWPILALVNLLFRPFAHYLQLDMDLTDQLITEEELRSMLDASREAGHIEAEDKDMIENVFEFDDTIVAEVMTHRIDVSALRADLDLADVLAYVNDEKYSRFPVYDESIDNVIGILHTKDLLAYCHDADKRFELRSIMRQPFFTPETRNIKALFEDLKQRRLQMAIVIDEYGGTAGVVTVEDLLEQLVGSIEDEYDDERQIMLQVAPDAWIMDGGIDLEQVAELLDVVLPDDYETLSGFVIDTLDRIPDENERPECTYLNLRFKVMTMEDNRIRRVRVTKLQEEVDITEKDDKRER